MKIALIGASGYVGRAITAEAVARGHEVTAIVRHPEKVATSPKVHAVHGDVFDTAGLATLLEAHDVAVSAYSANGAADVEGDFERAAVSILAAVERSRVPRLAVVGGAASLETEPGKILLDSPDFNPAWAKGARGTIRFLAALRATTSLDWTFLSPAAILAPGERTGTFRLGKDTLLRDAKGESRISTQDYAVAFVDELEKPAHRRTRFTVAY